MKKNRRKNLVTLFPLNTFTIFYGPSEKFKALYIVNCMLVPIVHYQLKNLFVCRKTTMKTVRSSAQLVNIFNKINLKQEIYWLSFQSFCLPVWMRRLSVLVGK